MRDRDKQAVVGDAVGVDANSRRYVGPDSDILARSGGKGKMNGGVGESALAIRGVEVLDQGGEGVEFGRSSVPVQPRQQTALAAFASGIPAIRQAPLWGWP